MLRKSKEHKPQRACLVPGCAKEADALIWGGRWLCYGHFCAFDVDELSGACGARMDGPTEQEWQAFVRRLAAASGAGVAP